MVPDQAEASGRPELEDQAEARDRAELEDQAEARGARIEARGLSRSFGPHQALCDLDLEIGRGETFGLLGANGAGKTTFIRLVTGYLIPSAGAIQVDGYSPTFDAAEVSRRIGFVAENAFIYRELRVEGFLRFAAGLRGLAGRDLHLAVRSSLERFHLTDVSRRLIGFGREARGLQLLARVSLYRCSRTSKKFGQVFETHPGSRMTTSGTRRPANENAIAMR